MAEDKRQAMLRFAKRGTALLTAIVMTVEQVPFSDALPVRALADEITDAPGLVGRMAMEGGTGVTVENGLISMSKKMTAKGYLHIEGGPERRPVLRCERPYRYAYHLPRQGDG